MISLVLYLFIFKCNTVNIKIILFFIGPIQRFFKYLFSKFISKCQKQILKCTPQIHVCDFDWLQLDLNPEPLSW